MSGARAVGAREFARLMAPFAPFEPAPALAVAVSGGRDSLALMLLAAAWAGARGGHAIALTVDHQLRPESAAEARQVRRWLVARGHSTHILHWTGPKPAADLAAAARAARYRLLEAWCRRHGVLHLLLAHQADDQAETLLLRLGRGSGLAGLAAMPGVAEREDVRLLRPLLPVPRARLAATLEAVGQAWIDDPGNLDPARARARLRAALPALGGDGLATDRLARTATELGRARAAIDGAVARLLAGAARLDACGSLELDLAAVRDAPAEVGLRALAQALTMVGGQSMPPRAADLAALYRWLCTRRHGVRTLGGCLVERNARKSAPDRALLVCEPAAATARLTLRPRRVQHWDGRFAVTTGAGLPRGLTLARLGDTTLPADVRRGLPRLALASLPALWQHQRLVAVPHLGWAVGRVGAQTMAATRLALAPVRPLVAAPFGIV